MARNYRTGIIITGDASGAVRAANLTEEQLKQLNATSKKTSDQFSDIASKTRDVVNAAAKWAMVAGGAAVTATAALVKNQMGLISSTANVSDMLGVSTEALARLRHQADVTGVSSNNLDLGIRRMTRRISEAAQGTGAAVKSLDELGLSAEALAKLSPDQQFDAIAEAMEGVENQSDRLRLAFSIFDTDGAALLNTMRGGSAAAREAAQFTEQWGLALSRVDAAKVEQASTAMGMVRTASEGFWKQLTVQLSPAITGIAEEILGWGEGMGTAEEAAQRTFETMTTWAGRALDVFRGVQVVWKGIIALTAELSAQLWETIVSVEEGIASLLNKLPSWMGGGTFVAGKFEREMATSLRAAADQLAGELHDLAMKAMPSDALAERLDKWRKDAEAAAEKVAASAAKTRGGYLATGDALEGLTTQEKARADAVSRALGDLSFQNQLLERELRATQAGEDALKAFNREKHIEVGLRSTNAKDMLPQELALYREQLAAQWDLQEAIRDAGSTTAAVSDDMAKLMEETSRRMGDSLVQVWRDFIDGGSNALDSMKKMLVDFLANAAHLALTRPIMISLGLAGSVGANAGGIGGGAAGGAGGIMGGAQSLSSLFSLGKLASGGGILMGANNALGQMAGNAIQFAYNQGWTAAGNMGVQWANNMSAMPGGMAGGLAINAAAGYAGNWAGNQLGGALTGKQANSAWGGTIGSVVGSIWGPIGTAIGGAIGGFVDSIFGSSGKKRVTLGVETDPNAIVSSRGYTDHQVRGASGLLFTGRETRGDAKVADQLVDVFAATDAALVGVYRTLTDITVDLTGQSLAGKMSQAGKRGEGSFFGSADHNKLVEEDVYGATDAFVRAWVDKVNEATSSALDLEPLFALAQEGELLADALIRLDTQFHGVTSTLQALDLAAYDTSVRGVELADSLVKAHGGLERFITGTDSYYRNFYTQNERFMSVTRQLSGEFDSLGQLIPSTRDGIRDIIDGLDLLTDAGRATFAAIMNASEGLSEYYTLLEGYQASITNGLDSFRDQLMMDILGDAGAQYDYLKAQADALGQVLPTLQDADAIARVKEEILDLSRQAYGLLDEEGRRQQAPEFRSMIDELERVSLDQLKRGQQQGNDNANAVAAAVETAMAHVTNEFQRLLSSAAQDQQQAAQLLLSGVAQFGNFTAGLPSNIRVNVSFPEAGSY